MPPTDPYRVQTRVMPKPATTTAAPPTASSRQWLAVPITTTVVMGTG